MSKVSFNLDKITEKNGTGFYQVSGASVSKVFYVGIDRSRRVLDVYLSTNFTNPIMTINSNSSIKPRKDIDMKVLLPVLARSFEILHLDYFPKGISYAA